MYNVCIMLCLSAVFKRKTYTNNQKEKKMKDYPNYSENLRKRRALEKVGYSNIVIKNGKVVSMQGKKRVKPKKKLILKKLLGLLNKKGKGEKK